MSNCLDIEYIQMNFKKSTTQQKNGKDKLLMKKKEHAVGSYKHGKSNFSHMGYMMKEI